MDDDLPAIGAPARRALALAGYVRLDQLTAVTEKELGALHGVGPKALRILRAALGERGASFAD
ncbi:DNA-binding protein [Longispora urticae]